MSQKKPSNVSLKELFSKWGFLSWKSTDKKNVVDILENSNYNTFETLQNLNEETKNLKNGVGKPPQSNDQEIQ